MTSEELQKVGQGFYALDQFVKDDNRPQGFKWFVGWQALFEQVRAQIGTLEDKPAPTPDPEPEEKAEQVDGT